MPLSSSFAMAAVQAAASLMKQKKAPVAKHYRMQKPKRKLKN
jgi:hypothetical protein